jgi:hypothetical protein
VGFDGFCDGQLYYVFVFCTPLIIGAGQFFWLFVTMMRIQQTMMCVQGSFLSAIAAGAESGGQPEVVR